MKKKRSWKKIWLKCKHSNPCDCGQSELCNHPENEDDNLCSKEDCPIWKRRA